MRRTKFLRALVALLLVGATIPSAAAAQTTTPRGVLTKVEYQELLTVQKDEKGRPKGSTLAQVANNACRPLTHASRITSTQHAECVAGLFFFGRLFSFTAALSRCGKEYSKSAKIGCIWRASAALNRATRHLISTDAASAMAARARGITGRCLGYLILTPRQARPVHELGPDVMAFARAFRSGNLPSILRATKRLLTVFGVTEKVFNGGSVTVCRHE